MQIVYLPRFPYGQAAHERHDHSHTAAEAVVARMAELTNQAQDRTLDFEDWHESAIQLVEAVATGLTTYAMAYDASYADLVTAHAFNTDRSTPDRSSPTVVVGTIAGRRPIAVLQDLGLHVVWPVTLEAVAANDYSHNPAFIASAGRPCAIGISNDEEPSDKAGALRPAVQDVARRSAGDIMLKVITRAKYSGLTRVRISNPEDAASTDAELMEALSWDLIYTDGLPRFLVQGYVPMFHEYRLFVVGGEIVAGAGCIEALCPPYNDGSPFDAMTEVERNDNNPTETPAIVDTLVAFARRVAKELAAAHPHAVSGTIDVAIGSDGEPLMIEMNPAMNCGLYAARYANILRAIILYAERRHDREPA